ncbi:ABC transporter ATP-binding protein [Streptococcus catagoni]|uniref:ABC transporter ATP-binding protein n=1 Tax=Streptococcus catagoni TaxID=2654874 RepID=UPI00140A6BBC|nr:ABC transporter ATP-binding protein [Streptococcus catagoni]
MAKLAVKGSHIFKTFQLEQEKTISVLKDVCLEANYGEFISILGISGSGKSTLLKCLSSLLEPSSGHVDINHLDPYHLSDGKLAKLRREDISFIFQSYNLVPALPVIENIVLPLRLASKKIDQSKIEEILRRLNFQADRNAPVATLSGGEQQKVAIARAILANSKIIFADEPTGALDSLSRQVVFDILSDLAKEGKCVLMVTHDIELASRTDRALILKDGSIDQELKAPSSDTLYKALGTATSH